MPRHVNDSPSSFYGPGALTSFLLASLLAVVGLGVPVLLRLRQVLAAARGEGVDSADAILVLGRALENDLPTPVFTARLDHGASLWRRGVAPRIVVAGGLTGTAHRTEADAGAEYLVGHGVPADAVLREGGSRHTLENLFNVREIARARGWRRLILVSDPLHLARAAALARGLGLDVVCSPAAAAAPRSRLAWWLRALVQAFMLHWYHVGVAYSRAIRSRRLLERVT